ncbi:MAG: hypothetical protein HYY84_17560 [Deltaproteobacteria bacterium]|nr:hypothetical protein [Deltaproteobacteria bacterium]
MRTRRIKLPPQICAAVFAATLLLSCVQRFTPVSQVAAPSASVDAAKSSYNKIALPKMTRIDLVVMMSADGLTLSTSMGDVATGCAALGKGPTVQMVGSKFEFVALQVCARRIRDANPHLVTERQVRLAADADTRYDDVIRAMDALRGDTIGSLFPHVVFLVSRADR